MKLWLLTQIAVRGYDTYDSCVVAAETEEAAKQIHPTGNPIGPEAGFFDWPTTSEQVSAVYLGEGDNGMPAGAICASFNAG